MNNMGLMQKAIALGAPFLLNLVSLPETGAFELDLVEAVQATPGGTQIRFTAPQLKPGAGEPGGRRRGAGGRGPCKNYASLTALVPTTKTTSREFVKGLTTMAHPTFWFYLPHHSPEAPIEFLLQDENENDVYRTRLQGPQTAPGIVSVAVPPTVAPLRGNRSYRWLLAVSCDPGDAFSKMIVRGSIQRVEMPIAAPQSLDGPQTALEKAILYANQGIWFDAVTALGAKLQQRDRNNAAIVAAWADLLKQGNLEDVVSAPILPCCTPQ